MTKLTYIGIKEDNKPFRVVNSRLLSDDLNNLPKGRYRLVIDKYRKQKSNPQLGYYFSAVLPLSMQLLNDAGWELTDTDQVDAFWKSQFANREIINRNTGEVMEVPALKRDMTTTEMMTFIDAIRDYCAEYLGGYIPEPETQIQIQYK